VSLFTCPLCHSPIQPASDTWRCDGSLNPKQTAHTFDVARQGYGNASFEVGGEEGLDIVEEFYTDDSKLQQQPEPTHDLSHVQDIQKGLQQSVQALN